MHIYFTASTQDINQYTDRYKRIFTAILNHHPVITSGRQIIHTGLLEKDKKLTPQQVFERQKKRIDAADIVIAESSRPSHGVGGEVVYALARNKPVLALIHTSAEDAISPMLVGNPSDNLFIEHYDDDNIRHVINEFIRHFRAIKKRRGKLIVVDGGDGSGKTTQAQLLLSYLKSKKMLVKYVDFPQYYRSFHGKTVAKLLRGEFGGMDQLSPYLTSLAYALDRASVKREMDEFLAKGGFIIANRYATSNMAHQAAKIGSEKDREEYLQWEYELEYKIHKIPKEDIVIYLHVPWKFTLGLTDKKGSRTYLNGHTQDIAEKDLEHRQKSEESYLRLAKKYRHWKVVECVHNGQLKRPEDIHTEVVEKINAYLRLA